MCLFKLWSLGDRNTKGHMDFQSLPEEEINDLSVLVNSCIRGVDRIWVRESRKCCLARPHEE